MIFSVNSRCRDFGHRRNRVSGVLNSLYADLDQLLPENCHRPTFRDDLSPWKMPLSTWIGFSVRRQGWKQPSWLEHRPQGRNFSFSSFFDQVLHVFGQKNRCSHFCHCLAQMVQVALPAVSCKEREIAHRQGLVGINPAVWVLIKINP